APPRPFERRFHQFSALFRRIPTVVCRFMGPLIGISPCVGDQTSKPGGINFQASWKLVHCTWRISMSIKTKIQWCDSTVNPTMGCDGCEIWGPQRKTCYAGTLHGRFGGHTQGYAPTFELVTAFPGRMAKAAHVSDL